MVFLPPPSPDGWESESDEEDGIADQDPLDINWIQIGRHRVGVCALPGNRLGGARRSLPADLETLKQSGITDIFVVCTDAELNRCNLHTLLLDYEHHDINGYHHPLGDDTIPSKEQVVALLSNLWQALSMGKKAVIHCTDGYGRACLVLSLLAMVVDVDLSAADAIQLVQQVRGPAAIQTVKQYNFIMGFHQQVEQYRATVLTSNRRQ